jgi:hypothetical protein
VIFEPGFHRPGPGRSIKEHIRIVANTTAWRGKPLFSELKSSSLIVNAPIKALWFGLDEEGVYTLSEAQVHESTASRFAQAMFIFDEDVDEDEILFKSHPCLLARSQTTEGNPPALWNVFIILKPVSEPVEGESYRRIGIGSYWNSAFNFDGETLRTVYWV